MRTLAPLLCLPFLLLGCGQADPDTAPVSPGIDQAESLLVPIWDPCKTHGADVWTTFPGHGPDVWGSQSWPSDGASYAAGGAFSCTSFLVDVGVPTLDDQDGVPSWYKGANLHAYFTMPDSPEVCATLHAYVRLYSKDAPQDPFALVSAKTVSGEWKTTSSGDGHCGMQGWTGFPAPEGDGGGRTYRYAIKVVYGSPFSAARPVTVVVSPL